MSFRMRKAELSAMPSSENKQNVVRSELQGLARGLRR